mgnify:CR=1 FL=1
MSKFFKLLCIGFITFGLFGFILIIFVAIIGSVIGTQLEEYDLSNIRANGVVINSQLYAERYRSILDKYLIDKDFKLLSELFGVSGALFTIFILHEPLLFEADSPDAVATSALATFTYALPKAIVLNLYVNAVLDEKLSEI